MTINFIVFFKNTSLEDFYRISDENLRTLHSLNLLLLVGQGHYCVVVCEIPPIASIMEQSAGWPLSNSGGCVNK